jgi:UDP:flavonoid glycosyltransferase YjiC (YdhE family)
MGSVAARVCGAASARMLFGSDGLAQVRASWRDQRESDPRGERLTDPVQDWLEPILERYGHTYDEEVAVGQWTIFPMPPWIWRPGGVHYVPVRHVPFNGPATTPSWLYEPPARTRICATFGLSHREGNFGVKAPADHLFEAVADLDVDVVATFNAKQLESAGSVPDNVRVVDFVPLNVLLPTCSMLIHSGGAGTFAGAIEHGVPQLIVPNTYYAEKWWGPLVMANGVEDRGAGVYVADGDQLTTEKLRSAILRVLDDPSYARNAERVRIEQLGMPSPNDIVPTLEKLTVAHLARTK